MCHENTIEIPSIYRKILLWIFADWFLTRISLIYASVGVYGAIMIASLRDSALVVV